MGDPSIMNQTFHLIMKRMVETGQAPFYTEVATELGVSVGLIYISCRRVI